jgi:hypothetical protein
MYLRFTPSEYHLIVIAWRSHELSFLGRATLRRHLASALLDEDPHLAWRVVTMPESRLRLLHKHLCDNHPPLADACRSDDGWLSRHERNMLAEVYASDPLPGSPARARKLLALEMLWELAPTLARKLERLNRQQYRRLVREVVYGGQDGEGS